jgi:ABC-type branched-subunit amino acid transport system permease subunit
MSDELATHPGRAEPRDVARRRRLDSRSAVLVLVLLVLVCVPLSYPFLTTYSYVLQIITMALMWVALTSSWNLIGGYAGYVSLGHNVFLAAGAYFSGGLFAYLRPEAFLTLAVAADMVLMAIIGRRGTVTGPIVGAVVIVAFNEISVAQLGGSEINLAVTGVPLMAALLFFPLGVIGTLREKGRLPRALDWD